MIANAWCPAPVGESGSQRRTNALLPLPGFWQRACLSHTFFQIPILRLSPSNQFSDFLPLTQIAKSSCEPQQLKPWSRQTLQSWEVTPVLATNLPFQHAIFLPGFILVSIRVLTNQRVFSVQPPALGKCGVVSFLVEPFDHSTAAVPKVFFQTLYLQKENGWRLCYPAGKPGKVQYFSIPQQLSKGINTRGRIGYHFRPREFYWNASRFYIYFLTFCLIWWLGRFVCPPVCLYVWLSAILSLWLTDWPTD